MAELDISKTTTTDMKGTIEEFSVDSQLPDAQGEQKEVFWDYPDASANLGYYKEIPEIKSAFKALAIYVCGQGWTADSRVTAILEGITGWGEDSFQSICQNLLIQKKVFGDAFAEIIRDEDTGTLLNIKTLFTGDMRVVVNKKGIIERYEQRAGTPKKKPIKFQPNQILHLVNDRLANEIHGISNIEVLKKIIDAKNEALDDERKIRHRELLGVLELDTDNKTKIAEAVTAYQNSVKNKEVLVTIKGTSELKDNPMTTKDRLQWLQYLDNLFYQTAGVPKVVATSEGFTEAGAKVGIFTFDPIYTSEQREMQADFWNQVAIRVKFEPAPSLGGTLQQSEEKNTGQTSFQPNETEVSATRTE